MDQLSEVKENPNAFKTLIKVTNLKKDVDRDRAEIKRFEAEIMQQETKYAQI